MDIISLPWGQDDIWVHISISEQILWELWIELREEYSLSPMEISQIHKVSARHACLESNEEKCYRSDAENGMLKLCKWGDLLGYIFAHKWIADKIEFYERGSLWVSKEFWGNGLGKYLMFKMTQKLAGENILSVTSNNIVQSVNELLMDYEILQPEWTLKQMIEVRWQMKDDYRYFINEKLMRIL